MFCALVLVFSCIEGIGLVFMFFALGLVFVGTDDVGSRFRVLRSWTLLRRYRWRRVPFSCFARPDSFSENRWRRVPFSCFARPYSFSAVSRVSGPFFIFYAPRLVFGGSEGVRFLFHVLRYRGCRVPFSSFALTDSFSSVPRESVPVFMFCAHGLVLSGTEDVGSRFQILRSMTHFRRYRLKRGPVYMSCAPGLIFYGNEASGPVFIFYAPVLIFYCTEGVGSRFHVLRVRTHFLRYRGCRIPFSCFARPDSFSAVSKASGPVFIFSRALNRFWRCRGHRLTFS
jgi:hypothetical protein